VSDLAAWNEILADENAAMKARVAELEHELSILNRALGDDHAAWVKYPTIQYQLPSEGHNQLVQLEIVHDGVLRDVIEAVEGGGA